MNRNDRLFHLLKLQQIPKLGAQKIGALLTQCDFDEFCQYDKHALQAIGWNPTQIQRWFKPEMKWIDATFRWLEAPENQALTLFDEAYPFLLKQISTAPPILFVQGDMNVLNQPQIAVVGSRDFSHYGEYWTRFFSQALVEAGFATTSGLALGIDGICHAETLKTGGKTIAVLGSGLAQVYPVRHRTLATQIIEQGGTILSEFHPNQAPLAEHFPRRNRIISGLSLGTLVIEAALNSGSLITARYALEQGREVFALPNSIQNVYSQGCHQLIKQGAILVDSIDDILEAISLQCSTHSNLTQQTSLFQHTAPTPKKPPSQEKKQIALKRPLPEMNEAQKRLFDLIGYQPISADQLAEQLGIAVNELLIELLNLELEGVIKTVEGGYLRAV